MTGGSYSLWRFFSLQTVLVITVIVNPEKWINFTWKSWWVACLQKPLHMPPWGNPSVSSGVSRDPSLSVILPAPVPCPSVRYPPPLPPGTDFIVVITDTHTKLENVCVWGTKEGALSGRCNWSWHCPLVTWLLCWYFISIIEEPISLQGSPAPIKSFQINIQNGRQHHLLSPWSCDHLEKKTVSHHHHIYAPTFADSNQRESCRPGASAAATLGLAG